MQYKQTQLQLQLTIRRNYEQVLLILKMSSLGLMKVAAVLTIIANFTVCNAYHSINNSANKHWMKENEDSLLGKYNSAILNRQRRQFIPPGTVGLGSFGFGPNYDTALSALAFLSFGVYMLNLILTAMNRDNIAAANDQKRKRSINTDAYGIEKLAHLIGDSMNELSECSLDKLCTLKQDIARTGKSFRISSYSENLLKLMSTFTDVRSIPKPSAHDDDTTCKNFITKRRPNCFIVDKLENIMKIIINNIGVEILEKILMKKMIL